MIVATALASVGVFIAALWVFGVVRVGTGVLATTQNAVAAMRDESLEDEMREKIVQSASVQLMAAFVSTVIRGALTFAASFATIWLADAAGLAAMEDVVRFLSRWDVIIIVTIALTMGYVIWGRIWRSK